MAFFGDIAGAVIGKAVGAIFGSGKKGEPQRAQPYSTPAPRSQDTSLLARSVMSGRQRTESSTRDVGRSSFELQGGYKGLTGSRGGKGLTSAQLISDEAQFWGALYNRAINESQATMPSSVKEQHGIFRK